MAEGKKSFVLYSDQRSIIDMLPDDKAGQLLKHIFAYVNDENPISNDPLLLLAFEPIKLQMKRDLKKWEQIKEGRSAAGKASAEARRIAKEAEQNSTNSTNVKFVQQTSTNPTVNVNVNDTVTVNVNENEKKNNTTAKAIDFDNLLIFINKTFGRDFKTISKAVRAKYNARIKEGYTSENIRDAMLNCKKSPHHIESNYKYCTPEFFSRSDKLDLYSSVKKQPQEQPKERIFTFNNPIL